jgi:hypothetical protein
MLSLQNILTKKSQEFKAGFKLRFFRPGSGLNFPMKHNCQYIGILQSMISPFKIDLLRLSLDFRFRNRTWKLLFQSKTNGTSLRTLVQKSANHSTLVLFISTVDNYLFGCFLNTKIEFRSHYYGTGETFIFTFSPQMRKYPASMKNNFFVSFTNIDFMIGGNGTAIHLQRFLEFGFSSFSETFDSPQLTKNPRFEILNIEVWSLNETISNH